ncbi:MAG: hypothetical protein LKG48_04635 [Lachnospiraceae bacterium]|jgi:hypothetical protein|nr:hypothetical protein [Lachnospiraceae bacterium]MCH4104306.1 hypothetical protein [Lachnospiraceae bacterium]MCI1309033.1 hypothetical protein [Lachnospiraceae bacterium]MCI1357054.1 hypothetical protein [Lachnospiraceae bacterium]MCI1357122.1 hypothetical protein [Lachnospiraceae bacterium]
MKITLEFSNTEEFYRDLPKFAALTGFSGQFANFSHVKKGDTVAKLEDPDLPEVVEKDGTKYVRQTQDQKEKLEAAAAVSDAVKAAEKTKKKEPAADPLAGNMNPPEEAAPAEPEKKPEAPKQEAAPDITEVRKVLHAVIKAGHRDEMKALLEKLGAANVTNLDPDKYVEFITEAKKIGGAA